MEQVSIYAPYELPIVGEAFKGEVELKKTKFPKDLGEEHPFDFSITEGLYKKFGFVTAVVDKYVDFIVGPGFFVKCEDERAKKIIEDFMRDVNFDSLLRAWCKEGLIKGNGILELGGGKNEVPQGMKVLDAKYMYVTRDNKGTVEKYTQYKGAFDRFAKEKTIEFEPFQIAHIGINKIGDCAYGLGIIHSAVNTINNLLKNEKDLHMLIGRKANSPIHVKIGSIEKGVIPPQDAVDAFGKKLEYLNNKHEWCTDPYVDMKVLDYGDIGEKFDSILNYGLDMLFFTFQVPEVLMGRGSIPEGLAKVQMEAFERRIQSMQAEIEKVIETQIFRRVLNANGFDVHVEFEWGQPNLREKHERLKVIVEMLKLFALDPKLRSMLEREVAKLMGFEEEELGTPEEEREKEETEAQPKVPGTHGIGAKYNYYNHYHKYLEEGEYKNHTLKEWLGFDYTEYLRHIRDAILEDDFEMLLAMTNEELKAGKLTSVQVDKLKGVLDDGFTKGASIREIAKSIEKEVRPKDLYRMKDGKIERDMAGVPILQFSKERRSIIIARSETTRMAVEGALRSYEEGGVEKVRFVASTGDRTCPECADLNGQIFDRKESHGMIPVHVACRCTFIPVVEGLS